MRVLGLRPVLRVAAASVAMLIVVVGCAGQSAHDSEAETGGVETADGQYGVVRVVDGDTVIVAYRGRTRVRVIGIDTPEVEHPYGSAECWGEPASRAAEQLLQGANVGLAFDPQGDRRDQYDRLLAYVTLPNGDDYGQVMLRRGHADLFYSAHHPRADMYRKAKERAQESHRGLWANCR